MKKVRAAQPWIRCAGAVAALSFAASAAAQIRLPNVNVPNLRTPLPGLQQPLNQLVPLQELRATLTRELISRNPRTVEADPAGEPIRRSELLWLSPSQAALNAALAQGFAVLRDEDLRELDIRQLVMRAPAGVPTASAAQQLRSLDARAQVDFNHLYSPSGEAGTGASTALASAGAISRRVGLIDGGVDAGHPALQSAAVKRWGCGDRAVPSEHGTAIASLLVGDDGAFRGVQPRGSLYAADVYCGDAAGGAAEDVARAFAWIARERVAVVNVSLVGPANALLERAVAALVQRGHVVVAAVGNDGPAAPPLYPASYRGVVGVTGVTRARAALPEAAQGSQVMFAAPGAEVAAARRGWGYTSARGTSFAAPFVAGLIADRMAEPDARAAAAAIARLATDAIDLGEPGRDAVYGFGLVGESVRVSPGRVPAH